MALTNIKDSDLILGVQQALNGAFQGLQKGAPSSDRALCKVYTTKSSSFNASSSTKTFVVVEFDHATLNTLDEKAMPGRRVYSGS
jgi:hypothetical protein